MPIMPFKSYIFCLLFLSLDDEDKAFVIASIKSKIESDKEERRKKLSERRNAGDRKMGKNRNRDYIT